MLIRNSRNKITTLSRSFLFFSAVIFSLSLGSVKSMISSPKIVIVTGANKGIGYEIAKQVSLKQVKKTTYIFISV